MVVVTGTQPMEAPAAELVLMMMQKLYCAMVEVALTYIATEPSEAVTTVPGATTAVASSPAKLTPAMLAVLKLLAI